MQLGENVATDDWLQRLTGEEPAKAAILREAAGRSKAWAVAFILADVNSAALDGE